MKGGFVTADNLYLISRRLSGVLAAEKILNTFKDGSMLTTYGPDYLHCHLTNNPLLQSYWSNPDQSSHFEFIQKLFLKTEEMILDINSSIASDNDITSDNSDWIVCAGKNKEDLCSKVWSTILYSNHCTFNRDRTVRGFKISLTNQGVYRAYLFPIFQ